MHTAFVSEVVVGELPMAIECLEAAGSGTILAGTRDGTLVVVGRDPEGDAAGGGGGGWHLLDAHKQFAKRALLQLAAVTAPVPGARLHLASLSDDGVAFHEAAAGGAGEFRHVETLPKTRGAHLFAWQQEHGMLAVAARRQARAGQLTLDGGRGTKEMNIN